MNEMNMTGLSLVGTCISRESFPRGDIQETVKELHSRLQLTSTANTGSSPRYTATCNLKVDAYYEYQGNQKVTYLFRLSTKQVNSSAQLPTSGNCIT